MNSLIDVLALSPNQALAVGVWAFLGVVALDLAASTDNVPHNTPRDWIISMTQWRSRRLWPWAKHNDAVSIWQRLMPFNYGPFSGAAVPFAFGALVGHFFHPGLEPWRQDHPSGLAIVSGLAATVSVLGYFGRLGKAANTVFVLAATGLVAGAVLWPVNG